MEQLSELVLVLSLVSSEAGDKMDYNSIQAMIAGLNSGQAAIQLAQQNPDIDPHMLLPQLNQFTQQQQESAAGSDAGMLPDPTKAKPPGDLGKALTGAKDLMGNPATAKAPEAHPFSFGQPKNVKPNVALPGGPTTMAPSFGSLMGARKNGY